MLAAGHLPVVLRVALARRRGDIVHEAQVASVARKRQASTVGRKPRRKDPRSAPATGGNPFAPRTSGVVPTSGQIHPVLAAHASGATTVAA